MSTSRDTTAPSTAAWISSARRRSAGLTGLVASWFAGAVAPVPVAPGSAAVPGSSPETIGLNTAVRGFTSSSVAGSRTRPTGTSGIDPRNVCGCQNPSCAPPWTNGTQNGAKISERAVPSRLIRAIAIGNPTNALIRRNAWVRQKLGPNIARKRAQKPPRVGVSAGAWASTSSSARAISASMAPNPRVIAARPISSGITSGVTIRPRDRLQTVTRATNQATPSGSPKSR